MRIVIEDEVAPEANAMLQALYSRSASSVVNHLERVQERGFRKFMESYYVGYGHESIGDCGFTTIFIEDVSILTCKAVQDTPLYFGQETSTRYLDFSAQGYSDPAGTAASESIIRGWLDLYAEVNAETLAELQATHSCPEGVKESVWAKTLEARAFDIARGFLPAGVHSQLSWTTNLRQAADHLRDLAVHPLAETRAVAATILESLRERYPGSFSHKDYPAQSAYRARTAGADAYYRGQADHPAFAYVCTADRTGIDLLDRRIFTDRPKYEPLPRRAGSYASFECQFLLDFGSFRDIQRHRNGFCEMPLLSWAHGFHPWYLDSLATPTRAAVEPRMEALRVEAERLPISEEERQNYLPLGLLVPCRVVYDLRQMAYVAELRSGKTVHATLRSVAHRMHDAVKTEFPFIALHCDLEASDLDARRGTQDIRPTSTP
ncbi:MAG: FAD-dependent thymidylate synthase [Alphaproteobacteria bacterium]|nr:FAD-dependent thymidylate synthase [Alphaproteobacteria bacterium]